MRMVVVLPAPLGPMNPYTSPRSSLIVKRFSAYRSPYIFVRSRVSIIESTFSVSGCPRGGARPRAAPRAAAKRSLGLRSHGNIHTHECPLRHRAFQLGTEFAGARQFPEP